MGNHIAIYVWKCFLGAIVIQNTRNEGHEQGKEEYLLFFVQKKLRKRKERKKDRHQGRYSKLPPRAVMQDLHHLYCRSNVSKNTGSVPDFLSSCHNACNKVLSTVNRSFAHQ